jgi:hypothetical protein
VKLQLIDIDNDHAFVVCGPIAVVIWRGTIDEASILETEALGMRALQNSPKGAGLLFFPESTTPPPPLRELTADVNERLAARGAVGVAGVFLHKGFLATVQRGIATGLTMLSAHSYPFRIFSNTQQACAWLGGELRHRGVVADTLEIARQLEQFRNEYLTHGSRTSELVAAF